MAILDRALLNAINRAKKPVVAQKPKAPKRAPPAIQTTPFRNAAQPSINPNRFINNVIGGTNRPAMGMEPAVTVTGSDGKMYNNPSAARAAGAYPEPVQLGGPAGPYGQPPIGGGGGFANFLSGTPAFGIQPGMNPSSGVIYPNQPPSNGMTQYGMSSGVIYPNQPAPAQPATGAPSSFYNSLMGGLFGGQPNMTQYGNGGIGYPMGYPAQQPVGGGLFGQPMTQYGNGGIGYPMGYPAQQPNMGQQYAMQQPNMNQQPQSFGNAGFSALNTNMGQQPQETRSANDFDSFAYRPL